MSSLKKSGRFLSVSLPHFVRCKTSVAFGVCWPRNGWVSGREGRQKSAPTNDGHFNSQRSPINHGFGSPSWPIWQINFYRSFSLWMWRLPVVKNYIIRIVVMIQKRRKRNLIVDLTSRQTLSFFKKIFLSLTPLSFHFGPSSARGKVIRAQGFGKPLHQNSKDLMGRQNSEISLSKFLLISFPNFIIFSWNLQHS